MSELSRRAPDVARADVKLVAVGEWSAGEARAQRAVADASVDAWRRVGWPDGLLSHWCLLGTDQRGVLHYLQAADEESLRRFASTGKAAWARAVREAAPEFHRHGVLGYRTYRGRYFAGASGDPACVVAVRREFANPDARQARAWVDAMFAATGEDAPLPGMIAAHMHVSVDGSRVLNLAQWTSERAHQELVDGTPRRLADSPALRRVETWPGLERTTVHRYRPYRYVEAATG